MLTSSRIAREFQWIFGITLHFHFHSQSLIYLFIHHVCVKLPYQNIQRRHASIVENLKSNMLWRQGPS